MDEHSGLNKVIRSAVGTFGVDHLWIRPCSKNGQLSGLTQANEEVIGGPSLAAEKVCGDLHALFDFQYSDVVAD